MEHMNERGTIYEIKRNICHFGCWLEMERIKIRSEHTYVERSIIYSLKGSDKEKRMREREPEMTTGD